MTLLDGSCTDIGAAVALLKECAKKKDILQGIRLHDEIVKSNSLRQNVYVGSALINMYAKCGAMEKAQEVFDELPVCNVVSWNALVTGYAQNGCGKEALHFFDEMQRKSFTANAVTFTSALKACAIIKALEKGKDIHAKVVRQGIIKRDFVVGTALIDMYAKCGELDKAQEVFLELPIYDIVCWNALIGGYAEHGYGEQSLRNFSRMQSEGVAPNAVTFTCLFKACGSILSLEKARKVHALIAKEGYLEKDIVFGNTLADMYAKCGAFVNAKEVLNELPVRDVVSWAVLIAGYAQHGHSREALSCFEQMQKEGVSPDGVVFACALKACGDLGAAERGSQLHVEISRKGLVRKDIVVGNALVDMYAKCGALDKAQQVFNELPVQDVISWTALIAGYAQHGRGKEARSLFERMQGAGLSPDPVTIVCILKASGGIGAADMGQQLHAEIVRHRWLEKNIIIGNALVDMYAKCGVLAKAQEVFDVLPRHDKVSWNVLVAGYTQHGYVEEALSCFKQMEHEAIYGDEITFTCILSACGTIGTMDLGEIVHSKIVRQGLLGIYNQLVNALVDMYAKCGDVGKAHKVFDCFPVHDVSSWNVLILGYSQLGQADIVFELYSKMTKGGVDPNLVTFSIVLTVCIHSGLSNMGCIFCESIYMDYGVIPNLEHYISLVDLFCRAHDLNSALILIKWMPFSPSIAVWHTFLGACQNSANMKLALLAYVHAIQLDETNAVAYVYMGNACVATGMLEDCGLWE